MLRKFREFRLRRLEEKFSRADKSGQLKIALSLFETGERTGRYILVCSVGRILTGVLIYYDTKQEKFYSLETVSTEITGTTVSSIQEVIGPIKSWKLTSINPEEAPNPDLFRRLLAVAA